MVAERMALIVKVEAVAGLEKIVDIDVATEITEDIEEHTGINHVAALKLRENGLVDT